MSLKSACLKWLISQKFLIKIETKLLYIIKNNILFCKVIFLGKGYRIILERSKYYFSGNSFKEFKIDFNNLRGYQKYLKEETPKDYYHYYKDVVNYNTKFPKEEIVDYYNIERFNTEIERLKDVTSLKDYLENSCSVDEMYSEVQKVGKQENENDLVALRIFVNDYVKKLKSKKFQDILKRSRT